MLKNPSLWRKIEAFQIGPKDAALSFEDRLARENGWSRAFAGRVIGEYKKFIYLIAAGRHMRTPSEAVDQAWHLHLAYTRSYWDGLCRDILGRPLHHGPTEGGAAEDEKFDAAYRATLDAYRAEFGAPPQDIWPPAEIRFRPARARWIDVDAHWIVPKRRLRSIAPAGAVMLVGLSASAALAEEVAKKEPDLLKALGVGAAGFAILAMIAVLVSALSKKRGASQHGEKSSGCSGIYPVSSCGSGGGKGGGQDGGKGCGADGGGSGCGSGGCGGGCGGS